MRNRVLMLTAAVLLIVTGWSRGSANNTEQAMSRQPLVSRQAGENKSQLGLWDRLREVFASSDEFSELTFGQARSARRILAEARCFDAPAISPASCNGFDSVAEYLAAIRASENLEIPFARVKFLMERGKSLEQAIRTLRPGVDYTSEVRRAREMAAKELREMKS